MTDPDHVQCNYCMDILESSMGRPVFQVTCLALPDIRFQAWTPTEAWDYVEAHIERVRGLPPLKRDPTYGRHSCFAFVCLFTCYFHFIYFLPVRSRLSIVRSMNRIRTVWFVGYDHSSVRSKFTRCTILCWLSTGSVCYMTHMYSLPLGITITSLVHSLDYVYRPFGGYTSSFHGNNGGSGHSNSSGSGSGSGSMSVSSHETKITGVDSTLISPPSSQQSHVHSSPHLQMTPKVSGGSSSSVNVGDGSNGGCDGRDTGATANVSMTVEHSLPNQQTQYATPTPTPTPIPSPQSTLLSATAAALIGAGAMPVALLPSSSSSVLQSFKKV
jgi:hypothetical protein